MKKLKLEELQRLSIDEMRSSNKYPIVIVLDDIRSGHNVGSIFRTADAFMIDHIYLCGITAQPPHKEILKTAIGAEKTVKWSHFDDVLKCLNILAQHEYNIIGVEQTTKSIFLNRYEHINKNEKYAIVFGNEVDGISNQALPLLDQAIEIPQFGTKHSLNVSVCAGIVLWHFANTYT